MRATTLIRIAVCRVLRVAMSVVARAARVVGRGYFVSGDFQSHHSIDLISVEIAHSPEYRYGDRILSRNLLFDLDIILFIHFFHTC